MKPENSAIYQRFDKLLTWADRERTLGIRANADLSAAIDGLNAASVGLIGASAVILARDTLLPDGSLDLVATALGVGALVALLSGRVGPVPLLLGGAAAGLVTQTVLA